MPFEEVAFGDGRPNSLILIINIHCFLVLIYFDRQISISLLLNKKNGRFGYIAPEMVYFSLQTATNIFFDGKGNIFC